MDTLCRAMAASVYASLGMVFMFLFCGEPDLFHTLIKVAMAKVGGA